ncbi:alpha/beta fold hydrolase [Parvibaculaceae bacterium PLY_AMNH_Bact1]|nr:alpha/beta fold hydrolase [Parvibaculaceae bacterium PLY_AMNH_Bact1]
MATFILVHGAWHDAGCWDRLALNLRGAGHDVHAPTLPGHGADQLSPWVITMEKYAAAIIDVAAQLEEKPICVGHSMAGFVLAMAAESRPDLFQKLIFLTAFVPNKRGRLLPMIIADPSLRKRILHSDFNLFAGTNSVRPATAPDFLYTDCAADLQQEATAVLIPQPVRPLFSSVEVTPARFGSVPKAFIECTGDQAIPIALQRKMQRFSKFDQVKTLEAAHSPFLSMPEKTADVLEELANV